MCIRDRVYADEMVCRENRLNLTKGRLPKKVDEIVVTRGLLEEMGLTGEIGDRITVPYQVSEDGLSLIHISILKMRILILISLTI